MCLNGCRLTLHTAWILFLLGSTALAAAQVTRSAEEGSLPLRVGAGVSSYYTEIWDRTRLTGPTLWGDWTFRHVPSAFRGLGVELEGRELAWGQPAGSNWSMATLGGGPVYSYKRLSILQPYAKYLLDFGMQWNIANRYLPKWYQSDKWMTEALGGGLDVHAKGRIWVRVDYEYQFWKVDWFNSVDHLTPQGFTLGAAYDLSAHHRAR